METGVDVNPSGKYTPQEWPSLENPRAHVSEGSRFPDTPLALRRPIGVTILGVGNYACAVLALVFGVLALTWPRMIEAVLHLDPSSYAVDTRILIFGACAFISFLSYLVAYAFMRLQNWVRVFTIAVSMFDLVVGSPHSDFANRVVSVILIWYLFTPQVRAAFHAVTADEQHAT